MKNVVIVGGGFAGVKVARDLRHVEDIHVTLISDQPDFRYSPALYRTATGGRRRESSIPLEALLRSSHASFIETRVLRIDRAKRHLYTQDGQQITYDYCVMALGVVTSYLDVPGLEDFSYSIKSADEVERLKRHLHEQLIKDKATDKNYVVVGAGPTGVELASALGQYLKRIARVHKIKRNKVTIELVEGEDRILPTMSLRASRLADKRLERLRVRVLKGTMVKAETTNTLRVEDRSIPTHTVIWTAGVANNPFFKNNSAQFELDRKQRVVVDSYLAVDDHLFVVGDNASTQYSGLALTAIHHAKYVSRTIKAIVTGGSFKPYHQLPPVYAVPLGSHTAIVQWKNVAFDGIIGGILRSLADLIGYADVMGYREAIKLWLRQDEFEESCPVCRSPQVTQ